MTAHWCMCCLESSQCHFKKCKSESKTLDYPEKKLRNKKLHAKSDWFHDFHDKYQHLHQYCINKQPLKMINLAFSDKNVTFWNTFVE